MIALAPAHPHIQSHTLTSSTRFLRLMLPTLKTSEIRAVLTYLHLIDLNGDGMFEFQELVYVSRV